MEKRRGFSPIYKIEGVAKMSAKRAFFSALQKIMVFCCTIFFGIANAFSANLPTGYTQLEYIESTGTQYIDLGMLIGSGEKLTVDIDFSYISALCFGAYNPGGSYSRGAFTLDYGDFRIDGDIIGHIDASKGRHTIKWNGRNAKPTVDGVEFGTATPYDDFTPTVNAYLFAENGGGRAMYLSRYAIYGFEVEGKMKLVPAKRNSDNEIGMYDTVSGTFFTNSGTGSFIAGLLPLPEHCATGEGNTCTTCESGYVLNNGACVVLPEHCVSDNGFACTTCESGYVLNNGACTKPIKIATTAYNSARFSPVVTDLNSTIATIRDVVTNTITQTGQIATLQSEKQTRPNETCPAGKKCLLVTDENGTPHWYEFIEPFNAVEFLNLLINTNGSKLYRRGNITSYRELGGNGVILISQPPADSGLRQLNETEWAVQWDNMGAVYGTTVCNGNSGTGGVASSTEQTETKGLKCWCKMTSVVDLGGVEHDVLSSSWVFQSKYTSSSATDCAASCANRCALNVRDDASFRSAMFGTVKF